MNLMRGLRRLAMIYFDSNLPMPAAWAPHILGFALGSKGHRIK